MAILTNLSDENTLIRKLQAQLKKQEQSIARFEERTQQQEQIIARFEERTQQQEQIIARFEERTKQQEHLIAILEGQLKEKDQRLEDLQQQVKELQSKLTLNSQNSSKPPSSDGLKKKKAIIGSQLKEKKKPLGGQKGHRGHTLAHVDKPDKIIHHQAQSCNNCGRSLNKAKSTKTIKRQVIDIKVEKNVTEHVGHGKACPTCQHKNFPPFPAAAKSYVQYGPQLRAFAVYLQEQFIPRKRLSSLFEELFGIPLSTTVLQSWSQQCAQHLSTWHEDLLTYLKSPEVRVKNLDETSVRVRGSTHWFHVMSAPDYTYYHHSSKRKSLLEGVEGIVVHDHWRPYFQLSEVSAHGLCNAHHLRELQAIIEEKEAVDWSVQMHRLLRIVCHWSKQALSCLAIGRIHRVYDHIIAQGIAYYNSLPALRKPKRGRTKKRKGHNLLLRLFHCKAAVLLCLEDQDVPATNNLAERDLRMGKVKQKVSCCFRSKGGVKDFSVLRSYLSTVKKQGRNILSAIAEALAGNVTFCLAHQGVA